MCFELNQHKVNIICKIKYQEITIYRYKQAQSRSKQATLHLKLLAKFKFQKWGAMIMALIKGQCTFGTFQWIMLTYVYVLPSGMVYISLLCTTSDLIPTAPKNVLQNLLKAGKPYSKNETN